MSSNKNIGLSGTEEIPEQYIDFFLVALVIVNKEQPFLEISQIFGKDKLEKFITIFEGRTIKIPSRKKVEALLKDVIIYVEAQKGQEGLNRLKDKYNLMPRKVRTISKHMEELFAKADDNIRDFVCGYVEDATKSFETDR